MYVTLEPSDDLYDNKQDLLTKFKDNPIGNSPEFMPWDNHLNQDVHLCHDRHKFLTSHLANDDENKFDGSTPNRLAQLYKRLLHPLTGCVPTPSRIIQDVDRFSMALTAVRESQGTIIDHFVLRTGKRHHKSETRNPNWGGSREKKEINKEKKTNLHSSIDVVCKDIIAKATEYY